MTNWPNGVDSFSDPTPSTAMNNATQSHSAMHALANDAIHAMQSGAGAASGLATVGSSTVRSVGVNKPTISVDTAANWAANNPVLGAFETAHESDTRVVKRGDGVTAYNSLPPAAVATVDGNAPNAAGNIALSATYAPGATPSTLGSYTGAGGYDRLRGIYRAKPAQLRRTSAALAAVRTGSGDCRIAVIGDSTSYGATATPGTTDWPTQLVNMLANAGYPSKGEIDVGFNVQIASGTTDTRWSHTGSWSALAGFFCYTGSAGTITFASTKPGTAVTIFTYDATPVSVSIDGGAATQYTPTGTSPMMSVQITGLADTTHTVALSWVSGTLIVQAVEVSGTASGIRLLNAGLNGEDSSYQVSGSGTWGTLPSLQEWAPHLVVVNIGMNDIASPFTTGETSPFTANVQQIITTLGAGSDIILAAHNNGDGRDYSAQFAALYGLADSNDLPLVDHADRLGTMAQMRAVGTGTADAIHPDAAGYAVMARQVYDLIAC